MIISFSIFVEFVFYLMFLIYVMYHSVWFGLLSRRTADLACHMFNLFVGVFTFSTSVG